jgi:hypothetical protein
MQSDKTRVIAVKPVSSRSLRFVFSMVAAVSRAGWAQAQNACDLNNDGAVNAADVNLAVNMAMGLASCTANIVGAGVCNMVMVQRVLNAVSTGACVTTGVGAAHSVTLTWTASASSNVAGYNLYRQAASSGTFAKVNSALIGGTTYTDANVTAGQTYEYVATAVDTNNNESSYSPGAQVTIPSP